MVTNNIFRLLSRSTAKDDGYYACFIWRLLLRWLSSTVIADRGE